MYVGGGEGDGERVHVGSRGGEMGKGYMWVGVR